MLDYIWLLPTLPLLGFLILILTAGNLPKRAVAIVGAGSIGLSFLVALIIALRFLGSGEEYFVKEAWVWMAVGGFDASFNFYLDGLSLTMMLIITGIGFLIHLYATGYMADDPNYSRFFSYMNLFVAAMLMLVLGDNLVVLYLGWEGVGLCSYLLIGFWYTNPENGYAARNAFVVTRVGDTSMAIGLFLLFASLGTLNIQDMLHAAETQWAVGSGLAVAVSLLLLGGAVGKSAQLPLQTWLPDAMAGPTPISALIHAATMVTAGVYLVARSSVLFALAPLSSAVVAGVGVLTALFAATIALKQNDIKKVLAYSTISQLGYMFLGVGVGAYTAGIFHLMTHAFFKALLFLGAGAVIHSVHHALHHTKKDWDAQDMRNMGGLKAYMPYTWITMWLATVAIAGIWPFAGFFSKDEIIWMTGAMAGAEQAPYATLYTVYWILALAAAMLTAFYMTRLMVMTFHGENRTGSREAEHLHEAPRTMWIPLVVLALLSVFGGWINVSTDLRESVLGGFGLLPMGEWLHHWLEPVTEAAHLIQETNLGEVAEVAPLFGGVEWVWGLISFVAALGVVVATLRLLGGRKVTVVVDDPEPTGFARILYNKWYVDEFYHRWVVDPVVTTSRVLWRVVDTKIIDGTVNMAGNAARALGWVASLFQTGQVNTYAFVLTLGVLVILSMVVF